MDISKKYDVVVVGGGPGGWSAAAAAAGRGASVLLIERYGFLGGMATTGLVNPFMGYDTVNGENIASGVFNDFIGMMGSENALNETKKIFDDEAMKIVLDRMMASRGVDVLFHSYFADVRMREGDIKTIYAEGKSGRLEIRGGVFVDSTGDGDVAWRAGCPFEKGRKKDGFCQPMTLCFRLGGVEAPEGEDSIIAVREELNRIFKKAKKEGRINNPREDVLVFRTLVPGIYHFNTTRILHLDATSSTGFSEAETEGRRQAYELFYLFKESPMFKKSFVVKLASQVGVRETRRIQGEYVLTGHDVLAAGKFNDGIAKSCYPIDIHNPLGSGAILEGGVLPGDYYEIPYRSLVPVGVKNLVIGSRCVSATHEAHGSLRVMPVVSAIGEAAGLAAAKAAAEKIMISEVDGSGLKKELFGA